MPLIQSSSKEAFNKNIAAEIKSGKSPEQSAAIAYSVQRENRDNDEQRRKDVLAVSKLQNLALKIGATRTDINRYEKALEELKKKYPDFSMMEFIPEKFRTKKNDADTRLAKSILFSYPHKIDVPEFRDFRKSGLFKIGLGYYILNKYSPMGGFNHDLLVNTLYEKLKIKPNECEGIVISMDDMGNPRRDGIINNLRKFKNLQGILLNVAKESFRDKNTIENNIIEVEEKDTMKNSITDRSEIGKVYANKTSLTYNDLLRAFKSIVKGEKIYNTKEMGSANNPQLLVKTYSGNNYAVVSSSGEIKVLKDSAVKDSPFDKGQAYYYAHVGDYVEINGKEYQINLDYGKIGYGDTIGLTEVKTGKRTKISKKDFVANARIVRYGQLTDSSTISDSVFSVDVSKAEDRDVSRFITEAQNVGFTTKDKGTTIDLLNGNENMLRQLKSKMYTNSIKFADSKVADEKVSGPRGTFTVSEKSKKELEAEGYGYHHSFEKNGKTYYVMTKNNIGVACTDACMKDENIYNSNSRVSLTNLPDKVYEKDFNDLVYKLRELAENKWNYRVSTYGNKFKIEIDKAVGATNGSYGPVGGKWKTMKTIYSIDNPMQDSCKKDLDTAGLLKIAKSFGGVLKQNSASGYLGIEITDPKKSDAFAKWLEENNYHYNTNNEQFYIEVEDKAVCPKRDENPYEEAIVENNNVGVVGTSGKSETVEDADSYKFKLTKKKNDYDEYVIQSFKNGKYDEASSYYTDDWEDAVGTIKAMASRQGLTVKQQGSVYVADAIHDSDYDVCRFKLDEKYSVDLGDIYEGLVTKNSLSIITDGNYMYAERWLFTRGSISAYFYCNEKKFKERFRTTKTVINLRDIVNISKYLESVSKQKAKELYAKNLVNIPTNKSGKYDEAIHDGTCKVSSNKFGVAKMFGPISKEDLERLARSNEKVYLEYEINGRNRGFWKAASSLLKQLNSGAMNIIKVYDANSQIKDAKMTPDRMVQIITPIVREFAKKKGVDDYWKIHKNGKNVSVGIELGYKSLDELCDILNKKLAPLTDSYFEPADAGLIETTIFDSAIKDKSVFSEETMGKVQEGIEKTVKDTCKKYAVSIGDKKFTVEAKSERDAALQVVNALSEQEDERLSPMSYKKLRELGYNENDWKGKSQEWANKTIATNSKSSETTSNEKPAEKKTASEEVPENIERIAKRIISNSGYTPTNEGLLNDLGKLETQEDFEKLLKSKPYYRYNSETLEVDAKTLKAHIDKLKASSEKSEEKPMEEKPKENSSSSKRKETISNKSYNEINDYIFKKVFGGRKSASFENNESYIFENKDGLDNLISQINKNYPDFSKHLQIGARKSSTGEELYDLEIEGKENISNFRKILNNITNSVADNKFNELIEKSGSTKTGSEAETETKIKLGKKARYENLENPKFRYDCYTAFNVDNPFDLYEKVRKEPDVDGSLTIVASNLAKAEDLERWKNEIYNKTR